MKDRYSDDQPSKPNAGYDSSRHAAKGDRSDPNSGTVDHPEKVGPGEGGISKPSAGPHDRGKDPKIISKPEGGDADIPKESLHEDKKKFEHDRKHEPKSKGATDSGGGKFVTSKRD